MCSARLVSIVLRVNAASWLFFPRWRMCTWCGWSPTIREVHLVHRSRIPRRRAYATRRRHTRVPLASVWNSCVSHLLPLRAAPRLQVVRRRRPSAPLHMAGSLAGVQVLRVTGVTARKVIFSTLERADGKSNANDRCCRRRDGTASTSWIGARRLSRKL